MNLEHNPIHPEFEPDIERVTLHNNENLVQNALEQLDLMQHNAERLRPEAAMLTTNSYIENRQVRLVDARDGTEPHFKAYFKLDNWVAARDQLSVGDFEDEPYAFEALTGASDGNYRLQARRCQLGDTTIRFIYGESVLTTDGLVELRLPADTSTLSDGLSQALKTLTGHDLWDDAVAQGSFSAWKESAYRTYFKLPEGPLTAEQAAAAAALHIEQTAPDNISLIARGQHQAYELEWSPGEHIAPIHEVMRLENALNVISEGVILSSQHRLERGFHGRGRSAAADMLTGGGDVVYTYARPESHEMTYSSSPTFRLRPETLDRMDVRAYETDAYGSKETTTQTSVGEAMGRPVKRFVVTDYAERLSPQEFKTLRGVHELCFQGSVAISECSELVVPETDESSFHDFWWDAMLVPHVPEHVRYKGNEVQALQKDIAAVWGDEAASRQMLDRIGFEREQIDYLVAGMNLPIAERAVAKLRVLGIENINGRPASDFIRSSK